MRIDSRASNLNPNNSDLNNNGNERFPISSIKMKKNPILSNVKKHKYKPSITKVILIRYGSF